MHAHHGHDHFRSANARRMATALGVNVAMLAAAVAGRLAFDSLALLADAGHMATDAAALGLSQFAVWLARRPATAERSFGFYRVEVLAALANAATLIAISFYIFWEAYRRLGDPPTVKSGPMLVVAVAGLVANAAAAWVLLRGGGHEENLNTRGAFLHVVGDMLGSVGAIVAAVVMLATGWYLADPVLSAGIGLLILWGSWRLLREAVDVLMEATPKHVDPAEVRGAMVRVPGVEGVHDLHIWTVTSGLLALSSHIEIRDGRRWHETLLALSTLLRERFGIAHVTLQPEEPNGLTNPFRGCSLDSPEGRSACLVAASMVAHGCAHRGHRH